MTPAKPKMLFVDDRSHRIHAAFLKHKEKYDVTIAPNVIEALRLLSAQDWDVVSLDFDLNGYDFCDPDSKDCAMEIVRTFVKTGWPTSRHFPDIIIHSSNLFGAQLLRRALLDFVNSDRLVMTKSDKMSISIKQETL